MKKVRLYEARNKKGYSQEYMAQQLSMDTASYHRREKGMTKISSREWLKLAQILELPMEEIQDRESPILVTSTDISGNKDVVFTIPREFIDNRTRYIKLLEDKILTLENQLFELKENS